MAGLNITDGTGNGNRAKVNSNNRLYVSAIDFSEDAQASLNGDSYNINTGPLYLTSANKSAVLYLKNNEANDMVVQTLFYLIGNSSGGSGDMLVSILRNPTTGTIVASATDVEIKAVNRNFGSAKTITIDAYKGFEGATFTNGTKVIESIINQTPARIAIDAGTIILPKGASIGIEITPATGNTSLSAEFALATYIRTED